MSQNGVWTWIIFKLHIHCIHMVAFASHPLLKITWILPEDPWISTLPNLSFISLTSLHLWTCSLSNSYRCTLFHSPLITQVPHPLPLHPLFNQIWTQPLAIHQRQMLVQYRTLTSWEAIVIMIDHFLVQMWMTKDWVVKKLKKSKNPQTRGRRSLLKKRCWASLWKIWLWSKGKCARNCRYTCCLTLVLWNTDSEFWIRCVWLMNSQNALVLRNTLVKQSVWHQL